MIYSGASKASKASRAIKAKVRGAHPIETKVREATTSEAWGPTGTQLRELAAASYENRETFEAIFKVLEERLDERGSKWRKCSKSLQVIDYLMKVGHPSCCNPVRIGLMHIKIQDIKTSFRYIDPATGKDIGSIVRTKADELLRLANDEELLADERERARSTTRQISGQSSGYMRSTGSDNYQSYGNLSPNHGSAGNQGYNSGRSAITASGNIIMNDPITPRKPASARTGEDRYYGGKFGVESSPARKSDTWQSSDASHAAGGGGKTHERASSGDLWPPSPVQKPTASAEYSTVQQPVLPTAQTRPQVPVQQPLRPPPQQPLRQPSYQGQARPPQQSLSGSQGSHVMQTNPALMQQPQRLIYMQETTVPQHQYSAMFDTFDRHVETQHVQMKQQVGMGQVAYPPANPPADSSATRPEFAWSIAAEVQQQDPFVGAIPPPASWPQQNPSTVAASQPGPLHQDSKPVNPFSSPHEEKGSPADGRSARKKLDWGKADTYLEDLGQGKVKLSLDNLSISTGDSPQKTAGSAEKSISAMQAQSRHSYQQPMETFQPFAPYGSGAMPPDAGSIPHGAPTFLPQGTSRGLDPQVANPSYGGRSGYQDSGHSQGGFF